MNADLHGILIMAILISLMVAILTFHRRQPGSMKISLLDAPDDLRAETCPLLVTTGGETLKYGILCGTSMWYNPKLIWYLDVLGIEW